MVALCGAVRRADRLKRTHQSMDAAAVLKPGHQIHRRGQRPRQRRRSQSSAPSAPRLTAPRGAAAVVLPADVSAAATSAAIIDPAPVPRLGPAPTAESHGPPN